MDFIKKLLAMRNALGMVIIGAFFAVVGLVLVFSGVSDGSPIPFVFVAIGICLLLAGIRSTKKEVTTSVKDKAQYNRVDEQKASEMRAKKPVEYSGEKETFVYHFAGKLNQDQVMKDSNGELVYEALCEKVTMMKDTPFHFHDLITGEESRKMISHTITHSAGESEGFHATISSTFKVDGVSVWDVIADMGYSFTFGMHGIACHYEVSRWGENIGYAELGGTGLMNPKYKDNPLGKVPTNGIFKVECRREDIPGLFLICFALSRTEETFS